MQRYKVMKTVKIYMEREIPDWAKDPHAVLDEEEILDELQIDKSDLPYLKAVVAHNNHDKYQENVIRIELRIGNKDRGWEILEESKKYADKLEDHDNFIGKYHHDGDGTYVSFIFEVPEAFEEVYEYFE